MLVGASDGIFALSLRGRIAKAWLFEPDLTWHRPLALTLRPWPGKFEIVAKFMSDCDTEDSVTLDSFMRGRGELHYLQADVEAPKPECSKVRLARSAPIHHSAFRYAPITTMMMRLCCLGCFRRRDCGPSSREDILYWDCGRRICGVG